MVLLCVPAIVWASKTGSNVFPKFMDNSWLKDSAIVNCSGYGEDTIASCGLHLWVSLAFVFFMLFRLLKLMMRLRDAFGMRSGDPCQRHYRLRDLPTFRLFPSTRGRDTWIQPHLRVRQVLGKALARVADACPWTLAIAKVARIRCLFRGVA